MRSFFRVITFALQSIFRNFWLSFVTTTMLLLTLFTVNAVITLNVLAQASIDAIEDRVQVDVYFIPGTSQEIVKSVHGYLLGLPQVKNVTTITAEEALTVFKEQHASDPEVLAALDEVEGNPFGDALRVQARNPDDFPFILEAVNSPEFAPFIKEKEYADYQTVINRLSDFTKKVRLGGLALAAFFTIISMLIVFNAIRVAIYVHKDEIAVMRLVGAKDWFIRGPFLVEAMLYALVATVCMTVVVAVSVWGLDPYVRSFFSGVPISLADFYHQYGVILFFVEWIGLSLLGIFTTAVAMREYMKT